MAGAHATSKATVVVADGDTTTSRVGGPTTAQFSAIPVSVRWYVPVMSPGAVTLPFVGKLWLAPEFGPLICSA